MARGKYFLTQGYGISLSCVWDRATGFPLYYVKRLGNVSYEFNHDGTFVVVPII